ncbi:MAG TPA: cytochrome c [Bryobacteraceae bacterium]|nr:cytochrome c [Bryobacteraceae bacterium]
MRTVFIGLAAAALLAGQAGGRRDARPSPASGSEMCRAYCASCHGLDGRGRGPAAAAMKRPPTDLTTLARRNGGKFPEARVYQSIEGDAELAAHGSREMPVWGTAFRTMGGSDEASVKLRVRNLTRYIESLQLK